MSGGRLLQIAVPANSTDILVAVGFAEALSAPEVVWSLVDAGFNVTAFSRRGRRASLRHSKYVTVHEITAPEADAAASAGELAALLGSRGSRAPGRHVLLPLDDASLWLCGRLSSSLGWTLAGASGAGAELALDKGKQIQAARAAGFNVPESFLASKTENFADGASRFPLILRPSDAISIRDGRLRKGKNWICSDKAELGKAMAAWAGAGTLLVQPFLQGTGEGVFGLAVDAGVAAWSAHRRLRMMNPHGSGSSACVSQPVPAEARLAVERLVRQTGWRGLFMVELLRDQSGKLWFVELNGRPWGSMALSRRQGFEYPAWAVNQALNSPAPMDIPVAGDRPVVCRNAGREAMHLLFVLRGSKSKAIRQWPSFWRTLFELLRVRRGDTLYNWRRGDLKVFFSDFWYTLRDNLSKSHG